MKVLLDSLEYDLYIIEDDLVPLGSSLAHTNYYVITICLILLLLFAGAFVTWSANRRKLVDRLTELRGRAGMVNKNIPLTHRAIKDEIREAENALAANFI